MAAFLGRLLLPLLCILRESNSSSTNSRSYNRLDNTDIDGTRDANTAHNVTTDCGNWTDLQKAVWHCHRDLRQLASNGYPWSPNGSHISLSNVPTVTNRINTLRDPLDSLNYACRVQDRSQTCLKEKGIPRYCRAALAGSSLIVPLQMDFQFICHKLRRNENLVRSLQCLRDKRVLVMLFFHVANRCGGMSILDDMMTRFRNAYFYTLDIKPYWGAPGDPQVFCVPRSVISTCIKDIIEDQCGTMGADIVQHYLIYLQHWFGQGLQSGGLTSKICDHNISSDVVPNRAPTPEGHTKLDFVRLLEITAPGTALDTVYGRHMLAYLRSLSEEELCTTYNTYIAYSACVMSSDAKSERSKFNILQFAHEQLTFSYHGTLCSRLKPFTACWNLLQEICGPTVRGLKQHAALLVEGCEIQSQMDTVGCHWQGILLGYYINASNATVWPTVGQCLQNPMNLEDSRYSFKTIIDDLDTVISYLQPGVEELSTRCGLQSAKRLRSLLKKLRYLQLDAFKYRDSLLKHFFPE